KSLARDALDQVRAAYEALSGRDARRARAVVHGDGAINRQYDQVRKELKEDILLHADQLKVWLQLMNTARNLERIADHAADIAQMIVYPQEGNITRHHQEESPASL